MELVENSRYGEKSIRTVLMTPVVLFLELIRILFIMTIVVGILGSIVGYVYLEIGTDKLTWQVSSIRFNMRNVIL